MENTAEVVVKDVIERLYLTQPGTPTDPLGFAGKKQYHYCQYHQHNNWDDDVKGVQGYLCGQAWVISKATYREMRVVSDWWWYKGQRTLQEWLNEAKANETRSVAELFALEILERLECDDPEGQCNRFWDEAIGQGNPLKDSRRFVIAFIEGVHEMDSMLDNLVTFRPFH